MLLMQLASGFYCWVLQESVHDVVWIITGMRSHYVVTYSRKQEEVTLDQCLGCDCSVDWGSYRVKFALQD